MKTLKLRDDFYWVGIVDKELRVFDIIMETEFGTTYNSYVLKAGTKGVLFETAKVKFFDDYIEKVREIIPIEDIEYLVVDHTEPDHAGSIERLLDLNPNVKIVGTACAIGFLKNIVNRDFYSMPVKDNSSLKVGNRTLHFHILPNLHWPDTMYTYVEEENILISCDSFGAHYGFDGVLRSKVTDEEGYWKAAKYYFDNIIGPFKPFMMKALDRIEDLEIEMICTGHGPVLDCKLDEMKKVYREWCTVVNPNARKTVIIPYVSAYGYTGELAEKIAQGIRDSGDVDVRAYDMVEADQAKVLEELMYADGLLLGTPTILGDALKPIWDLTSSMYGVIHGGKIAAAFGSYGWSGEAVQNITERLRQLKMKVQEGFRVKFKPSQVELIDAYEYGYNFGCVVQNKENPKKASASSKKYVKCLVCGEIFEEGTKVCPVCGVGPENFVPVEMSEVEYENDTDQTYVVLGNGVAAVSAAEAIRERDKTGTIMLVSDEQVLAYNRPMLTKTMLASFDPSVIAIHDQEWYEDRKIINLLGRRVEAIDAEKKIVSLSDGMKLNYDKCIYALGSECFIPPIPGKDKEQVIAIRKVTDIKKIERLLPDTENVVVIGGGVLGLEAAWELAKAKCKVTVLEQAPQLMGRQIDKGASELLCDIVGDAGVDIRLGVQIKAITGEKCVTGVELADGQTIPADMVIVSAGVRANSAIAAAAGIQVDRAIVVDDAMRTSASDVFACGDCAQYEGINYAIWPEASEQGRVAGAAATGDSVTYETVSAGLSFHGMNSALFAIGDVGKNPDKTYKTVEVKDPAKKQYEKYYFINNRLSGAILIGDVSAMGKVTEDVEKKSLFKDLF